MSFAEKPTVSHSVVRLGDVVSVLSGKVPSIDKLLDTPLGPAPRMGAEQKWTSDSILKHLQLRGVHPESIRWSGPREVRLTRVKPIDPQQANAMVPAFVDDRRLQQAVGNAELAIVEYLNLMTGDSTDWKIETRFDPRFTDLLLSRRNIESIGGGKAPWTGEQTFTLQVRNGTKLDTLTLNATIDLPPLIVTTTRAIRKEEIITLDALTYRPLPKGSRASPENFFADIELVVGKQARRSISSGIGVDHSYIGEPIVVHRNDLIEVESVSGAIVVKLAGKALANGVVGELVEVELPNRKRVHGTVVSTSLVRLYGTASRTSQPR